MNKQNNSATTPSSPTTRGREAMVRYSVTAVLPEATWEGVRYLDVYTIYYFIDRPQWASLDWKTARQEAVWSERRMELIYPLWARQQCTQVYWEEFFTEEEAKRLGDYLAELGAGQLRLWPKRRPRPDMHGLQRNILGGLRMFGKVILPPGKPEGIDGVIVGAFSIPDSRRASDDQ